MHWGSGLQHTTPALHRRSGGTSRKFPAGNWWRVVTTAALGAGVDFPASQVIFDALAMGRDWLSVQEFNQMAGGQDGRISMTSGVLSSLPSREVPTPGKTRSPRKRWPSGLLKGEMEEVAPEHDFERSSEEQYVANAIACNGEEGDLDRINEMMVGSMEPVLPDLIAHRFVEKQGSRLVMAPLARVMAEHFIGMERLLEIRLTKFMDEPIDVIAELESEDVHKEKKPLSGKNGQKGNIKRRR